MGFCVLFLLLALVALVSIGSSDVSTARAASSSATLTSPTDGAQHIDPTSPFTWNPVSGADSYWLWIGTSPGANDVVNSGNISGTSYVPKALPPGQVLYARLWTYSGGLWSSASDVSFTAAPDLTYPTAGATNVDTSKPFTWGADSQATSYRLTIGTSQGASDLVDSGQLAVTSYAVPGLPVGKTLWARLTTQYGLTSTSTDISFTAAVRPATLTRPTDGSQHIDPGQAFTWNSVGGADSYWLWVGTSPGASDIVDSGNIAGTSYLPTNLPVGKPLYARLWTLNGGVWASAPDVSFSVAPSLTYPANGATEVDTTKPFTWTADTQATSYRLTIGTSQGASDLVDSGQTSNTSYAVPGLPAGKLLWARLTTQYGANSSTTDSNFTAQVRTAQLTYPISGSQNVDTSKPLTWNAVSGADSYWLWIGTSPGANDLVDSGPITGTSYLAKNLPAGKTLYARLWTTNNGLQAHPDDVSFTALVGATTITSPANGATYFDTLKPITWNPVPGADSYWLWVGSSKGGSDLVNTGPISSTSYVAQGLPAGKTLWARVWTLAAGKQVPSADIQFSASPTFINPKNGAQGVDATKPFTWTSDSQAISYQLTVGTAQGANNILDSGKLTSTSYPVNGLPAGSKLWARLSTKYGATTRTSDVSFTMAPSFKYPASGALGVNPRTAFSWSPAVGLNGNAPTYKLSVGTTPAGSDLYTSGTLTQASATVPTSALPVGKTLYARVATSPGDGSTTYADTVFTVAGTPTPLPTMVYPASGGNVDVNKPFQWTPTPLADAYRFTISSGNNVVRDSGEIQADRYFAEDLSTGAYTGELSAKVGGQWQVASAFSFNVTTTGASMQNEISAAQQETDFVRQMADSNNYPFPWTPLYAQAHNRGAAQAICSDFAPLLVKLLGQSRITARLPGSQQPADLDIGFMQNQQDVHTLVKMWNSDTQNWIMLDPMFDLTVKRTSDGQWASPQDMQSATASQTWNAMNYVFLGAQGDAFARKYYIDYPLLYLQIDPSSSTWPDPRPYMTPVDPPTNAPATYAISSDQNPVTLVIDGKTQSVNITSGNGLSNLFLARSIALPQGSTAHIQVYRVNRYLF